MTVYAFTRVTPFKFGNLKVAMDCLFAVLPGFFMRWSDPVADSITPRLLRFDTSRKWIRTEHGEKVE